MSSPHDSLRTLDYAVLQQCMHCGLCLPTCPTYDATHHERNSPRGRIGLMRAIADGRLEATKTFAEEMYYCLGCLACQTACPAGVDYAQLFETARSEAERSGTLQSPTRDWTRRLLLAGLFTRPRLLRFVGRLLRVYQASGLQRVVRTFGLTALLPARIRQLEPQTPQVRARFSHDLIRPVEGPAADAAPAKHRVAVLTGCVQDLVFSDVNRDTVDVLLANGCEVHTPPVQPCCGSLHAHNGELDAARTLARRALDLFDLSKLDAVITNAAGCGGHLKGYGRLLEHDPAYRDRAAEWSRKCKDITEYLVEIGFRKPRVPVDGDLRAPSGAPQAPGISGAARSNGARRSPSTTVTYHEACHLCHGQKITAQPRELLRAIPGLDLVELTESTWCCGSAGIYNIVQPAMSADLLDRKLRHVAATGATCVATANPGCHLQLENGLKHRTNLRGVVVRHPVSLLAAAYREEKEKPLDGGD